MLLHELSQLAVWRSETGSHVPYDLVFNHVTLFFCLRALAPALFLVLTYVRPPGSAIVILPRASSVILCFIFIFFYIIPTFVTLAAFYQTP